MVVDLPLGMLPKCHGEKAQLHALDAARRTRERFVEPLPEVQIGKQAEAKHRDEVRNRPGESGSEFEDLQEQDGDQRCPEPHMQCIDTGLDKGLDPQSLLDHFEEDFDLPAVFVDGRDGGTAKYQLIGQENECLLVLRPTLQRGGARAGTSPGSCNH